MGRKNPRAPAGGQQSATSEPGSEPKQESVPPNNTPPLTTAPPPPTTAPPPRASPEPRSTPCPPGAPPPGLPQSSGDARPSSGGGAPPPGIPAYALSKSMEEMALCLPMPRDRYGTRGQKIALFANFLRVGFNISVIYHYDIDIKFSTPRRDGKVSRGPTKNLKIAIMGRLRQQIPKLFANNCPAFDGEKNLYTCRPLPLQGEKQSDEFSVELQNGKSETFIVAFQLSKCLDLQKMDSRCFPQDVINALDIVFRQAGMNNPNVAQVGRNLFDPRTLEDIGHGRNLWHGRHQSLRPTEWAPLALNIDVTASTFYKDGPLVNFVREFLGLRPQDETRPFREDRIDRLFKELFNVKVLIEYDGRKTTRPIKGITKLPAATQSFDLDGKKKTVEQYFRDKYQIALKYKFYPCVQIGAHAYIPMELCRIAPKQRGKKTMTDVQSRNMIKALAQPPAQRKRTIENQMRDANYTGDPYLQAFGVSVDLNMMKLNGRILQPPTMVYAKNGKVTPRAGQWDGRSKTFYTTSAGNNQWAIVNFDPFIKEEQLSGFHDRLINVASGLGLSWSKAKGVFTSEDIGNIDVIFKQCLANGMNMIVVTIAERDKNYSVVKQKANTEYGIMTQCATKRTVDKQGIQDVANICLKINAKLGGINFVPQDPFVMNGILKVPTILVGADATHPDSMDTSKPSIAALVASEDRYACRYNSEVRVQQRRLEPIADLKDMMKNLLKRFFKNTQMKPHKIIYYRDGVGESQFTELLLEELRAIRRACQELQPDYKPAITFILLQKKHHTRFFPQDPKKDGEGRGLNIPAGTVADRDVVNPNHHNFYLSSHAAIQGTSRPIHYFVLCDDGRHSTDDLQALTFNLCHAYANCARSVSVPAPSYYAHKACTMARSHLDKLYTVYGQGPACDADGYPDELMKKAVLIKPNIENTMYFI